MYLQGVCRYVEAITITCALLHAAMQAAGRLSQGWHAGIGNCFTRVTAEQGFASFWRGNLANVVRYFPTQAFNFAFKDTIKAMFPHYNAKTDFWKFFATNMASGAVSLRFDTCALHPVQPMAVSRSGSLHLLQPALCVLPHRIARSQSQCKATRCCATLSMV